MQISKLLTFDNFLPVRTAPGPLKALQQFFSDHGFTWEMRDNDLFVLDELLHVETMIWHTSWLNATAWTISDAKHFAGY